jgi:hypothetical protein
MADPAQGSRIFFRALLISASVGLCGCAASGAACPQSLPIAPAPLTMIYPMNGATNVPDGNFTLVVAYTTTPPMQLTISGGSSSVTAGPWGPAPSPLPSPATSPPSGQQLFGASVGPLQSRTTYSAYYTQALIGPCATTEILQVGSFTTQ